MSRFFTPEIVGQIVEKWSAVPRLILGSFFIIIGFLVQIDFAFILIVIRDNLGRRIVTKANLAPLGQILEALHNVLVFDMRIHVQCKLNR